MNVRVTRFTGVGAPVVAGARATAFRAQLTIRREGNGGKRRRHLRLVRSEP